MQKPKAKVSDQKQGSIDLKESVAYFQQQVHQQLLAGKDVLKGRNMDVIVNLQGVLDINL